MSFYTCPALFVVIFGIRRLEIEAPGFLARPPCQGVQQFGSDILGKLCRLFLHIDFNSFQFLTHVLVMNMFPVGMNCRKWLSFPTFSPTKIKS